MSSLRVQYAKAEPLDTGGRDWTFVAGEPQQVDVMALSPKTAVVRTRDRMYPSVHRIDLQDLGTREQILSRHKAGLWLRILRATEALERARAADDRFAALYPDIKVPTDA